MAWTKEDRSFKILNNRQLTDSNKKYFEELGAPALSIYFDSIKTDVVAVSPATAVAEGVAQYFDQLVLTLDATVPDQQCYYAADNTGRLTNWIDPQRGVGYEVQLFNNGTQVPITDASQWFFDYQTGILTFNGNATGFTTLQLSGYRYIGAKGQLDGANAVYTMPFAQLKVLVDASKLRVGCRYVISNFQTIHQIPGSVSEGVVDVDNIHYGSPDVITLTATSATTFAQQVTSVNYPQDIIYYDFNNQLCEDTLTPRPGKITYREDTSRNIQLSYDWRQVLFRRWTLGGEVYPRLPVLNGALNYESSQNFNTFSPERTIRNVEIAPCLADYNNIIFMDDVQNVYLYGNMRDSTFNAFCESVTGFSQLDNCFILGLFTTTTFTEMVNVKIGGHCYNNTFNTLRDVSFTNDCIGNKVNGIMNNCIFHNLQDSVFNTNGENLTMSGGVIDSLFNGKIQNVTFSGECAQCVFYASLFSLTCPNALTGVIVEASLLNLSIDTSLTGVTIKKSSQGPLFVVDITMDGNLNTYLLPSSVYNG